MLNEREINDLVETERNLIGAVILRNEYFDALELTHDDFHEPLHREIYREIELLSQECRTFTPIEIKARLPYDEMSGHEVGPYIVHMLSSTVVNHLTLLSYQAAIKEGSTKWHVYRLAEEIAHHEGKGTEILDDLEKGLSEIHGKLSGRQLSMNELIDQSINVIEEIAQGKEHGVSTGLKSLDAILGGFFNQELIIIAGRPGMGKSTLAMQIAMNIARRKFGCIFFNLEMAFEMMVHRIYTEMLFREGGFNLFYNKIRQGVNAEEMGRIARASHELKELPIILDDRASLSLSTLKTRTRAYMRQLSNRGYETKVIFIDYLQLMTSSNKYSGQRVQEVSEITRGLKTLAKELNITIVALSQLSRAVESRTNKRPMLSDLRESGSIEQDADVVMFSYRHEYYLNQDKPEDFAKLVEWQTKMSECKDTMEVIISKQRSGETGAITLPCAMGASKVYENEV